MWRNQNRAHRTDQPSKVEADINTKEQKRTGRSRSHYTGSSFTTQFPQHEPMVLVAPSQRSDIRGTDPTPRTSQAVIRTGRVTSRNNVDQPASSSGAGMNAARYPGHEVSTGYSVQPSRPKGDA